MTKKQFDRLTPARRRMAVAQDVLDTLALPKRKRFKPTRGVYCLFDVSKKVFKDGDQQLRDLLPRIERHCEACAMGALLISYVRIANHVTVDETVRIPDSGLEKTWPAVDDDEIIRALEDFFPLSMLREIELAFEQSEKWNKERPTKRLRAICENIVENKGKFYGETL